MTTMMMTESHSTTELCRASSLSYRVIDHWVRNGAVTPSLGDARGSGSRRVWSDRDATVMTAIGRVWYDLHRLDLQCSTTLIRRLWTELHRDGSALIAMDTLTIGVQL